MVPRLIFCDLIPDSSYHSYHDKFRHKFLFEENTKNKFLIEIHNKLFDNVGVFMDQSQPLSYCYSCSWSCHNQSARDTPNNHRQLDRQTLPIFHTMTRDKSGLRLETFTATEDIYSNSRHLQQQ